MSTAHRPADAKAELRPAADPPVAALACELPADAGSDRRIWIAAGVSHRLRIANPAHRARLLAAIFDLEPDSDLRLILLGEDVNALREEQRLALRARVAFLPATGGLLNNLDAWENIVLPLGFHQPQRLRGIAAPVHALLTRLGAAPEALLGKLPEQMTLLEKKITGFVRILLEAPELVLIENFASGLDSAERTRIQDFAATYHASHPRGTLVQLGQIRQGERNGR